MCAAFCNRPEDEVLDALDGLVATTPHLGRWALLLLKDSRIDWRQSLFSRPARGALAAHWQKSTQSFEGGFIRATKGADLTPYANEERRTYLQA